MIYGNKYYTDFARKEASKLLLSYGGGTHPNYKVCAFSLAHYQGFNTFHIDPNDRGIELVVEKSIEEGKIIEYNPTVEDVDLAILYAVGLSRLRFLRYDTPIKEYSWGSTWDTTERAAAMAFAEYLKPFCITEEDV